MASDSDEDTTNQRLTPPLPIAADLLPTRLRYVHWIGGGSGAGKSTVAQQLAANNGLRLYRTDDTISTHARRLRPTEAPLLAAFLAMDMDERWASRSPEIMLKTFPWFAGEGFGLIVEDLLALPEDTPILVEGFRLLPRLVAPLLSRPNQAVWLAPTPEFRHATFDSRGFTWEIPRKTSKPEQALSNLLARDDLFTQAMTQEANALQLPVITVDGAASVDELKQSVADALSLRSM